MIGRTRLLHGLLSGAMAGIAGILYDKIYCKAFVVDFDKIIGPSNILISSIVGCMLMAVCYSVVLIRGNEKYLGILNLVFAILSFASITGVLWITLPLDIEFPEMFPGLAIPMHFFPVLSFLTLYPFFKIHN